MPGKARGAVRATGWSVMRGRAGRGASGARDGGCRRQGGVGECLLRKRDVLHRLLLKQLLVLLLLLRRQLGWMERWLGVGVGWRRWSRIGQLRWVGRWSWWWCHVDWWLSMGMLLGRWGVGCVRRGR